ncbi:hypothetical protein [uncultured Campylobacter sp.]|uniref:hypothetical protein n=1 Tax=uncultured Campylobacter sp. TaxID=218934 RepID=UPI00262A6D31|nr:hypothetical protein [uncultured Campylobacter sp.]
MSRRSKKKRAPYSYEKVNTERVKSRIECLNTSISIPNYPLNAPEIIVSEGQKEKLAAIYKTPFGFSSEALERWCKFSFEHVPSNYRQIELVALQTLSAILVFHCDLNINPFWVLDISDSGTGKGTNLRFQKKLFKSVIDKLKENAKFNEEHKNAIKDNKSLLRPTLFFGDIKATQEGFYATLTEANVLYFLFGEIADTLKNPARSELLNTLTEQHGSISKFTPGIYKNAQNLPPEVSGKIYIYADTNIQQLGGDDKLVKAFAGGFINRFILIYTKNILKYEDSRYKEASDLELEPYLKWVDDMVDFFMTVRPSPDIDINSVYDDPSFDKFARQIHSSLQDGKLEFKEFYNRQIYNLQAIIQILHCVTEYDRYQGSTQEIWEFEFNNIPSSDTIKEAIRFCGFYFDVKPFLQELDSAAEGIFNLRNELLERIKANPSLTPRDILMSRKYRKYGLTNSSLSNILDGFVKPWRGQQECFILI